MSNQIVGSTEEAQNLQKQQKLDKLFIELEKSIESKQFKLSQVICDAILKIDPANLQIIPYVERIMDVPEEDYQKADWTSFAKLAAFLMTPGLLMFVLFYRLTRQSEERHKDYFDEKEKEAKEAKEAKERKNLAALKAQEHSHKKEPEVKSLHKNHNKHKFSTISQVTESHRISNEMVNMGSFRIAQRLMNKDNSGLLIVSQKIRKFLKLLV